MPNRGEQAESDLAGAEYESHIHEKWQTNRPLDDAAQERNRIRIRSKTRASDEHVFGYQENSLGGKLVRTIGRARGEVKIGLMNLTYNFKRYLVLIRPGTGAPAAA